MTATDHLGPQFMSVHDLGQLRSQDYPDKSMSEVHAMMGRREQANDSFKGYMDELRGDIRDSGIQHPVQVDPGQGEYGNGHHRYHAAMTMGISHLPVTADKSASTGPNDAWYS